MKELLHPLFALLWTLFGSLPSLPERSSTSWVVESPWSQNSGFWTTSARSRLVAERCREHPDYYVRFPMVINGAQTVSASANPIAQFSDSAFREIRSTYGRPELACRQIIEAPSVTWTVSTDSQYFAHYSFFPYLQSGKPLDNVFDELLNVIACGTMLVFAVFCFIVFLRTVSFRLAIAFATSSFCLSVYFAAVTPGLLNLRMSMLASHRLGDASLCLGFLCIYYILKIQGLVRPRELQVYTAFSFFAVTLQLLGSNSDEIQMGTLSIFVPTIIVMLIVICRASSALYKCASSSLRWLQFIGLVLFMVTFINDMLVVSDAFDSFLVLPIGLVGLVMFLALGVQEEIAFTYKERDFLRTNLEKEVERKTLELKRTQAELVQSAKLASLGTLSAGLAHEINNSINFVNGAIVPLGRLIAKMKDASPRDYEKGRKLLDAVTDGVNITVSIVRSLRQFTGVNQSKFKDVQIIEVIKSVSTILGSRLRDGYRLVIEVDPEIHIYGDVVGINQILMNLITNALDAMPAGGIISIKGKRREVDVTIEVVDQGCGIPRDLLGRIFDPFFTTKEVGAGTGLGLYIIATEMQKHGGKVDVMSTGERGTTISLTFPERTFAGSEAA